MELIRNLFSGDRDAQPVAMPATFAGRFLVECAVASGETSVVWRATEIATGAPVALKFFSPRLVHDPLDLAAAQQALVAAQQVSHPRVVAAREVVVSDRYAAFVTPWIEGPTLRQMLCARPARFFEVEELRRWLHAMIDAVEAAHAHGVVHGALNPDIVLQQAGELRVVGFGVNAWLRAASQRRGRGAAAIDDVVYRSPAQQRGEKPRATDDVFSLGAMTYELLAGTLARGGWWSKQRLPLSIAQQRRRNGGRGEPVPLTWEQAIRRCLERRERDRIGSVHELRLRLELGPPELLPPAAVVPPIAQAAPPAPRPVPAPQAVPPSPPVSRPPPRPSPAAARPPLRGDVPLPSTAPAIGATATTVDDRHATSTAAPVAGALLLRSLFVVVSMVTIGVGGWLAWQIYQRNDAVHRWVTEVQAAVSSPPEELPATESAPVSATPPEARRTSATVETPEPVPAEQVVPKIPATGAIEVRSAPPGAEVHVPGHPVQRTPFLAEDLAVGTHPVEVYLAGYAPYVTIVDVTAGQRAIVEARLEQLTGGLHVESDPVGVSFVVRRAEGGTFAQEGTTPGDLRLPAGRYVVNFRHGDGSRSHVVDVDVNRPAVARAIFPKPAVVVAETPGPPAVPKPEALPAAAPLSPPGNVASPAPQGQATTAILPTLSASAQLDSGPSTRDHAVPANPPANSPATEIAASGVVESHSGATAPRDATTPTVVDEPAVAPAEGPPLDGGIFELGSVDVAPRLIERVDPQVPRRRNWAPDSARIELIVVIDRMGRVASASVHSTTDESLVAPSLKAVRLWRFSPASKRGQAVPVRVAVPLVFQSS